MNGSGALAHLLPVELGRSGIMAARGVRAGGWVFANGVLASDFRAGLDPRIGDPRMPNAGRPRAFTEAAIVLERTREVLQAGGSDLDHAVRTDQYYPHPLAAAHYQAARRLAFGGYIPPSTSILVPSLLLPRATVGLEAMAVLRGTAIEKLDPPELEVPAGAGFTPVVVANDLVFVAGMLAAWQPGDLGGIAPQARVPEGHLWKGVPIKLEADYIFERKIGPALAAAGCGFEDVVKAQVYLTDVDDIPAFNEVWSRWLGRSPAVRCFVPTARPGFAIADARVEINVIAARGARRAATAAVEHTLYTPWPGDPLAVRCGDLLFISGLLAADSAGLAGEAVPDPAQPWFTCSIEAQMTHLLQRAEALCAAAGASLADVVRIQQFHTDLAEFVPAARVWQRFLPGVPLPLGVVQVPAPLPVPGCTVMLDLWVHLPGG